VTASFGKVELPLIKASYGDKIEPAFLSYMGGQEQDEQTQGTYKADELKITMSAVVFRTIFMPAMPSSGGGNARIPIVIGRTHPDLGDDSDLLESCRCMNLAAATENSNKAEEVEVSFSVRQVKWTNDRKTINALRGQVPTGAIGF
jgi:hypothetical protein